MFKTIVALLLTAIIACSPVPTLSAKPLPSVQPIQYQGRTFCTVFSINESKGLFASAGHCAIAVLQAELDGQVTILGMPATVEMVGLLHDVAVFHADAHVPALDLATRMVEVCDPKKVAECETVTIQGFPYGLAKLVTVVGHVAARDVPGNHPTYQAVVYSDVLDITTAGGNSGSPVMNKYGEVVGILWGGYKESSHSLSVPLTVLRSMLLGYTED